MSVNETELTKWISLAATPMDKALLSEIARRNGRASESATIRRLIQEEAKRQGIVLPQESGVSALEMRG